ncbi:MAG TPA: ABC transporter substrate-binding protein [Stellaceae bacterium]|jgi:ABC-type nitrate/sulfonate/bicarbonate transport system substrate-binding protein|nr:ABC transporter substrate-binding protein [Stellaceae bacterium]
MKMKHAIGAALACALAYAAPAKAADTIQMGLLGAANAVEWPYYIGQHEKFFADAGIDLQIIYVPSPASLVQQLSSGSLDICDIGAVEPIHGVAHGAPVAILRISEAVSPYDIVAKSSVNSIKDLKGHTVVIGGLLDINRVYLERVLKAVGIKDSDIDITVAGSTAARFAALKSGSADVTMLAPPVNFFAENEGFKSLGLMIDYTEDLPFGSTDVARAFAEKHPDTIKRFMTALDKSFAWFNDNSHRDASIDILATEMKTNDRDSVAKSYDYLRKIGFFPNDGTISRKHIDTLMNEMAAIGDTDGKVPFDKLVVQGVTKVGD